MEEYSLHGPADRMIQEKVNEVHRLRRSGLSEIIKIVLIEFLTTVLHGVYTEFTQSICTINNSVKLSAKLRETPWLNVYFNTDLFKILGIAFGGCISQKWINISLIPYRISFNNTFYIQCSQLCHILTCPPCC